MVPRDEHVDRRHDKKGEEGADGHAADEHETDRVPGGGAGACDQGQGFLVGWKKRGGGGALTALNILCDTGTNVLPAR